MARAGRPQKEFPSELDLAQAVTALRKSVHLSRRALGAAIGVSGETVRRWEKGETPVPIASLEKVAKICGRTLTEALVLGLKDRRYVTEINDDRPKVGYKCPVCGQLNEHQDPIWCMFCEDQVPIRNLCSEKPSEHGEHPPHARRCARCHAETLFSRFGLLDRGG